MSTESLPPKIIPVWIAQLTISIIGSIIVLTTSLQSAIVSLQGNPTLEQHVAAAISVTSIVLHFFISLLLYLSDPPTVLPKNKNLIITAPIITRNKNNGKLDVV